jgi:hypothetical protein
MRRSHDEQTAEIKYKWEKARHQWLTLVILATWEELEGSPRQIVLKNLSPKNPYNVSDTVQMYEDATDIKYFYK